LFSPNTSITWS